MNTTATRENTRPATRQPIEATKTTSGWAENLPSKPSVIVVAITMFLCLCTAYTYAASWQSALATASSIDYEGHVLWACANLAQGHNIYDFSHLAHKPWAVNIYNPLYLLVGAGLVKAFGVSFYSLRLLTMVSSLMCFLGLFIILKRNKVSDINAIIGTCFFASYLQVQYWSGVARVDMFGLALAIWGTERLLAGMEKANGEEKGINISAFVLYMLAFFAKQQYFVFPIVAAACYFGKGQKRLAAKFLSLWLGLTLAIGFAIDRWTGGYFAHLTYASDLTYDWDTISMCMGPFIQDPKTIGGVLMLVAAFPLIKSQGFYKLGLVLIAVALPLALYTMGLRGAYHNHLLCIEFAFAWLTALSLQHLPKRHVLVFLACMAVTTGALFANFLNPTYNIAKNTEAVDLRDLHLKDKLVLSEDASLPMSIGAKPVLIDGTTIFNVHRKTVGALNGIIQAIDEQQFAAVILNNLDAAKYASRIWPEEVVFAVKRNYKRVGTVWGNGNLQDVYVLKDKTKAKYPPVKSGLTLKDGKSS